ncbi:urease accessory protein UreE [Ancylobacter sp. Lp-2]|uniref:urease accessory protein UreE n=1 Tax=Ancylobacter sp. Lp-2 TaxID=2881339 RepID=UPI001E65447C|nr:urease accessory protein UreE [Ancylobacter sp. Lp-2]MCB4771764.1 urease accessory protein UreE [Ancylobacter sp. Lp-2]
MIRARTLVPAGSWDVSTAADKVVLPHDGRHRRRIAMRGEGDVVFLLDLPEAVRLKDGDGIALEDGRLVAVVAAEEPVAEIVARDPHHLARLAWHLGNRHVPAQLLADRIRIARDGVLEEMARGLGATVDIVEASFEPEGGAYEAAEAHGHGHAGHDHGDHDHRDHDHGHHDHDHAHHGHEHHEHGEACGCGHDHGDHHHQHDVIHIGSAPAEAPVHRGHGHEHHDHQHKHADGEACGCGHDHHDHDHEHHGHDHHHDHSHKGHGHGHG